MCRDRGACVGIDVLEHDNKLTLIEDPGACEGIEEHV